MERPETDRTAVEESPAAALVAARTRPDSDSWLARLFLIILAAAGLVTWMAGVSPETVALCPCPFHFITHVQCPGCGMTRACLALAHGDVRAAWQHHPFALALVLLALGFAFVPQQMRRRWRQMPPATRNAGIWSLLILAIGFWAHRLLR